MRPERIEMPRRKVGGRRLKEISAMLVPIHALPACREDSNHHDLAHQAIPAIGARRPRRPERPGG